MNAIVQTRHLERIYPGPMGAVRALKGVNISLNGGEIIAIIGPSGSGKSTLLNILGCLDIPSGGEYWLNGCEVSAFDEDKLADVRNTTIGFVFQSYNLLPWLTAEENVALPLTYAKIPRNKRKQLALEALARVSMVDRSDHRPAELSGGQQQRVAIARAIINKPKLLLADEPTGNLDSKTGLEILELFSSLRDGGMTIALVTHDNTVAAWSDRILRLEDGVRVQ